MIAITNEQGLILELSPDLNMVTEQAVAWLTDDELPGEFSYPIDVPLTDNNKRFVEHGYRPDLAKPRSQMAVLVRMDGVLYRRCTFNFRVNAGKLSGFLKLDSSEFYDKIRKLSLLEALPDIVFLGDGLVSTPPVQLGTRLKQIAALPPGQFPCTFFPIRNQLQLEDSFDASKLTGFVRNEYINAWERLTDGSMGFPTDLPNMPKFGYLLCPQFYLSYVLERIMTLAGYQIESDWLASSEAQMITVENLTAMSQHVTDLSDYIEGHKLKVGLFLPDTTVSDFLKAVKGRFGLVFTFNANTRICTITQFRSALAAGSAIDLTQYQSGDYSTGERYEKGYAVTEFIDESDELYKDAQGKVIVPAPQTTGLGQTPVTLRAGTSQLAYEKSPLGNNAQWFVPTVRQAGNVLDQNYKQSERYLNKDGKRPNDVGIKFLYYRGMTTDSKNNPYPLGTPDVRDGRQVVVGKEALTLAGRKGAWRTYLGAYYFFRDQALPITQPLLMPVSILSGLKLDRLVSLSLEDHIRRSYLITKIQAQAPGSDGLSLVRLECLSIPPGLDQPADPDQPLVWVELIQSLVTNQGTGNIIAFIYSLTIKCWTDAQRTTPAIVTNLPITLRAKKVWRDDNVSVRPDKTYEEVQLSYLANGASSVIDPRFITHYSELPGVNYSVFWDRTVALDPSDEYNIIPK